MIATKVVERWLSQRIGLDPASVGGGLLDRALSARMSAVGIGRRDEYVRHLQESVVEQEALIEEVVVSESWFFRDERPFQVFRESVLERAAEGTARPPLRVLCIPCAGGEEPYSLAMTLLDLGLPPGSWSIDAVDVSTRALEVAARGVYRENAFRGRDLAFRDRHFRGHPTGYELAPEVRRSVRFHRGNLLDPDLLRGVPPYDVIFCRNLLIYLDPASRRVALDAFDRLLGPDGMLFLGHAERLEEGETRFEAAGGKGGFAYRRATAGGRPSAEPPARASKPRRGPHPAPIRTTPPGPKPALPAAKPRVPAATAPALAPPPPPSLDEAATLADDGRHEEAAALCERSIREAGPTAPAYFLLGMLRQSLGDLDAAEACLKKAIYLDPAHDDALLALSLLARRRGDEAAAEGYRRRAARALRRNESP